MSLFPSAPDAIALRMDGCFDGKVALLPSPAIQNHAAFLSHDHAGNLECVWFGGSLEGKSDICVYRSCLKNSQWTEAEQLSFDETRSEQNPIVFRPDEKRSLLIHTAQPGGKQDECVARMRDIGQQAHDLSLPLGTFVRATPMIRPADQAWLLPLFHCTPQAGAKWTGRHDTASVAISVDQGATWRVVAVPGSVGCVHMTLVPKTATHYLAFFRRRQADFIYRSESLDAGESWSEPVPTVLPNNNSSIAAIRLSDGRLAICCNPINKDMSNDRRTSLYDELGDDSRPDADGGCQVVWGVPRAPLIVAVSEDEGSSFPVQILVANSDGRCLSNNSIDGENHELSYPAIAENSEGGLDVAFTLHRRAIAHVRLSPEQIGVKT
ncbi:MAG: exo-alpha-sialidase [Thiolinea sp.]